MTRLDSNAVLTVFNDTVRIFRTDLVTRHGCGNKQYKLGENLLQLKHRGAKTVLSFGGLWSNHLHAFSIACEVCGLNAVAAVRGEQISDSALLNDAKKHGLKVHFICRSDYQKRHDAKYVERLMVELNCDNVLPEGGSNAIAVDSCREIAQLVAASTSQVTGQSADRIALAVGTGATMAGIINGASVRQKVIGIPVVQDDRLHANIAAWVKSGAGADWTLLEPAHPARYARVDPTLLEFVLEVYSDTGVILDPVYNAKALRSLLSMSYKQEHTGNTVFIHTGGLGGCLGFADRLTAIDPRLAGSLLSDVTRILEMDSPLGNS